MIFKNRSEAGKLLAQKLKRYKGKNAVVFAIPRGGVVTGFEIARNLSLPLQLLFARKISDPSRPELAVAAISESGYLVWEGDFKEFDKKWIEKQIQNQRKEIEKRKKLYTLGHETLNTHGKIAILVDDGAATGLTLLAGIKEIKSQGLSKIIVAVPVIPESTSKVLKKEADELIALEIPPEGLFLGAVAAHYQDFSQVSDEEVVRILNSKTTV